MGKTDNVIPFPKGGVAGLEPAVLIQLVEGGEPISARCVSVLDSRKALRHLLRESGGAAGTEQGEYLVTLLGKELVVLRYTDVDITFLPVTGYEGNE
jgi:hypothetical protein